MPCYQCPYWKTACQWWKKGTYKCYFDIFENTKKFMDVFRVECMKGYLIDAKEMKMFLDHNYWVKYDGRTVWEEWLVKHAKREAAYERLKQHVIKKLNGILWRLFK